MKARNLIAVACGSLAVAGCGGGGGGGGGGADPILGVGINVPINALSADLAGTANGQVTITFNADDTFTIRLPDGDQLTLGDAQIVDVRNEPGLGGDIIRYQGDSGAPFLDTVEIAIGVGDSGNEIFYLGRVDDGSNEFVGFEAYAVVGDAPDVMPATGTGTYVGRFLASSYIGGSVPNAEDAADTGSDLIFGDANIFADFGMGDVDVTLTVDASDRDFGGESLVGTDLPVTGTTYAGAIASGPGGRYDFSGSLIGGFFGENVEATAGTFSVDDTARNTELVGGYGAFR